MIDVDKQAAYWRDGSLEDWEVAQELIDLGRVRHALFLAHLALEKMLKALVCRQTKSTPPRIHNLTRLLELSGLQEIVQDYLRALEAKGLPVSGAVVFGSYAKNAAHEWSDIDVILISKRFDGGYIDEDIDLLWHTTLEIDPRIEPIACGEQQWVEDDVTPILDVARREGIVIEPEPQPT